MKSVFSSAVLIRRVEKLQEHYRKGARGMGGKELLRLCYDSVSHLKDSDQITDS